MIEQALCPVSFGEFLHYKIGNFLVLVFLLYEKTGSSFFRSFGIPLCCIIFAELNMCQQHEMILCEFTLKTRIQ